MTNMKTLMYTSENWYSNIDEHYVEVRLLQTGTNPPFDGEWRVAVWGDDDHGLIKDFKDKNESIVCLETVLKMKDITHDALFALGFEEF